MTKKQLIEFVFKHSPLPYKYKPEWEKHWRTKLSRMSKETLQEKAELLNSEVVK